MIAYGTTKTSSAFKLLARARNLDFDTSNEISKQIKRYEMDIKHAKENNEDDPDYNVNDYVHLEDYIDDKYVELVQESNQYKNIIMSVSIHPCARLVYHKDLREEIGIIRIKSKTGNKEPVYCVAIDGATADHAGYTKSDILKVLVVDTINKTFQAVGKKVLTVDELLQEVAKQPEVWEMYSKGFTMGLNQTEQPKTTQKVMMLKPKNIVELTHFVASIRPGAKSLVDDFINRRMHDYGIPSLDKFLRLDGATGVTGKSSFLFYDENILNVAQAAGIAPADAYRLIKAVKKKKEKEVLAFSEEFVPGYTKYLIESEGVDEQTANKTAEDIFTIIKNSASYLFCSAHAASVAADSLYGAYLKYNYPFEFYKVMLQTWTEKGNQEKIAKIIDEMGRYKNIKLTCGKFGEDNRSWYIDKERNTISQSLSSVKFMSQIVADDLYNMRDMHFDSFTDCLRYLQMNSAIDRRQIETLIRINYFSCFGKRKKLLKIMEEFWLGGQLKSKVTKTTKSWEKRMEKIRELEFSLADEDLPIEEVAADENELIGLCLTSSADCPENEYIVSEIDDKYSINLKLYSLKRGTCGTMKVRKAYYEANKLDKNQVVYLDKWKKSPRCTFKNGKRTPIEGEYELWAVQYHPA